VGRKGRMVKCREVGTQEHGLRQVWGWLKHALNLPLSISTAFSTGLDSFSYQYVPSSPHSTWTPQICCCDQQTVAKNEPVPQEAHLLLPAFLSVCLSAATALEQAQEEIQLFQPKLSCPAQANPPTQSCVNPAKTRGPSPMTDHEVDSALHKK
jgi:hypothetical protein